MTTLRSRRSLLADALVAALVAGGIVVIALGGAAERKKIASERDTAKAVIVRMAAGS
jgi:hypothetical protein